MAIAHINIGSNIGDRRSLIETAVCRIEASLCRCVRRSSFIESAPWGYDSPNSYLNLGLAVEVGDMDPVELLLCLRDVERSISQASHRNPDGGYADRLIDIDLIALGDTLLDTPLLTLPHPRMHLREFVLRPMTELDPTWLHPLFHCTASSLLDNLPTAINP